MSDNSNRVPAGIPAGGQFTTTTKTEADVSLAAEQMLTATNRAWEAEREAQEKTAAYVATALLAEHPDAFEVTLAESDQDGSVWEGVALLDREGNQLTDWEGLEEFSNEFWEFPEEQPAKNPFTWIRFSAPERRFGERSAVFSVAAALGE